MYDLLQLALSNLNKDDLRTAFIHAMQPQFVACDLDYAAWLRQVLTWEGKRREGSRADFPAFDFAGQGPTAAGNSTTAAVAMMGAFANSGKLADLAFQLLTIAAMNLRAIVLTTQLQEAA